MQAGEGRVTPGEQGLGPAVFDDAARLEDEDAIDRPERGQAVGDDERRAPRAERDEVTLEPRLGLQIEGARRLVEDDDRRVAQEEPRERDSLSLSAREATSPLSASRVVAALESFDEPGRLRAPGGLFDLRIGGARPSEPDVLPHGGVPDERLLAHDRRRAAKLRQAALGERRAVVGDLACARLVEAEHEVEKRALAGAALAHKADPLARRDVQRDLGERVSLLPRVGEAHVIGT